MIGELERYVDPAFVYEFEQGPARVPDEAVARQEGINCVSLAHLAVESLFNRRLPADLHCYEMFVDQEYLEDVTDAGQMQAGDLVWFGQAEPAVPPEDFVPEYSADGYLLNWKDSPVNHIAIYTGSETGEGKLMLHATHITGGVVTWPLAKFAEYARYGSIRRIARIKT